jgi:hypothetical protein
MKMLPASHLEQHKKRKTMMTWTTRRPSEGDASMYLALAARRAEPWAMI